jgi:hypothetical protein
VLAKPEETRAALRVLYGRVRPVSENNCEYKSAELDVEIGLLETGELHSVKITPAIRLSARFTYLHDGRRIE